MTSLLDKLDGPELSSKLSPEFSDEFPEDFEQDLPSAAIGPDTPASKLKAKLKPTGDAIPQALKRRLNAEIELYLELLCGVCEMRCERCAKVLEENVVPLAKRITNIVARYPDLADKLVTGGLIGDWIALLGASRVVAKQWVGHHVTHTIVYPEDQDAQDALNLDDYGPYRPGGNS